MRSAYSKLPYVIYASGVLLSGCASKQLLLDTTEALKQCTGELQSCQSKLTTCDAEAAALEDSVALQIALREECLKSARDAEVFTDELSDREARLREQLAAEIAAKDVEISTLKGQVSVRVLDKILFRSGSTGILPAGSIVLDKVASAISGEDGGIRVEGHTDSVPIGGKLKGLYASNWELSGARAAAVVRYFESTHDIDSVRMEAVGHSKYRPLAPNDTAQNQQRNRRVEIVLKGAG